MCVFDEVPVVTSAEVISRGTDCVLVQTTTAWLKTWETQSTAWTYTQKWLNGWIAQPFLRNPSRSYGTSPAIWDHIVLPTCYSTHVNAPRQADTRFTYHSGMKGWVDLGVSYNIEMVYLLQTVTQPSKLLWYYYLPTVLSVMLVAQGCVSHLLSVICLSVTYSLWLNGTSCRKTAWKKIGLPNS